MSDGASRGRGSTSKGLQVDLPTCGVIMPISETASHSEEHWRRVQTLLHRGILAAGFTPQNVWDSTSTDRISERIIGNIFEVPIAVADISDLNPNVMLELGLRLASKKPTVVVANAGGEIPFDIRDFHATFYPPDMNMIDMEEFFRKLAKALTDKHTAFKGDAYTPFLGNVIVDVASPETREVGATELVLSRLDEIASRLSSVEALARRHRGARAPVSSPTPRKWQGQIVVEIPQSAVDEFSNDALGSIWEVDRVEFDPGEMNGAKKITVHYSGAENTKSIFTKVQELAKHHGGDTELPF